MSENEIEKQSEMMPEEQLEPHNHVDQLTETEQTRTHIARNLVIVGIGLAFLGLIVLFLMLRGGKAPEEEEKKEDVVVSVKVATAETDSISKDSTAIGTVAPAKQTTVSPSLSAQIKQMRLLKNEFVQKGETIAVLASQDLQAQRAEAVSALDEAKLGLATLQNVTIPQTASQTDKDLRDARAGADNARALYERRKDLYAKGGISLKDLESSQLALTNAEDNLRLVEQTTRLNRSAANPNARALAETKITQAEKKIRTIDAQVSLAEVKAPITGVVTDQFQFEGDFAAQGGKLVTIADIGEVIIKANFADSIVADLKTGDMVKVFPPNAPDEPMTGSVTLISRSTDPQSRTVEVWARFANGRGTLRPGDSVQFVVSAKPVEDAVIVPAAAVQLEASNADEGTVMVVDKVSVAHETKVKVGIRSGDKIQITEGLQGGETVVVEGNFGLPDKTRVEVSTDEDKDKDKDSDKDKDKDKD